MGLKRSTGLRVWISSSPSATGALDLPPLSPPSRVRGPYPSARAGARRRGRRGRRGRRDLGPAASRPISAPRSQLRRRPCIVVQIARPHPRMADPPAPDDAQPRPSPPLSALPAPPRPPRPEAPPAPSSPKLAGARDVHPLQFTDDLAEPPVGHRRRGSPGKHLSLPIVGMANIRRVIRRRAKQHRPAHEEHLRLPCSPRGFTSSPTETFPDDSLYQPHRFSETKRKR